MCRLCSGALTFKYFHQRRHFECISSIVRFVKLVLFPQRGFFLISLLFLSLATVEQEPPFVGGRPTGPHPSWESRHLTCPSVPPRLQRSGNSPQMRGCRGQRSKKNEKCLLYSILVHRTNILGGIYFYTRSFRLLIVGNRNILVYFILETTGVQ